MAEPISRTELYQRVDSMFHEAHPNAPERLTRSSDHASWRESWIFLRDRLLDEEVNRVYWARHPDAPVKLDADSSEHEQWREAWRGIWEEVMRNAPEPEDVELQNAVDDVGNLDLSYLKAAVREQLVDRRNDIDPNIFEQVVDLADTLADEVGAEAMRAGTVDGEWSSRPVQVTGRGEHRLEFRIVGWWADHYFSGSIAEMTISNIPPSWD